MDRRAAIYRFCNYRERSQQEVKDKLYELGSHPEEVNTLLAELIEADLLNEERFAKAFVRGKFRLKHWGRIKLTYELKAHRLSEYVLKKAFNEIDPSEYFETAERLAANKWNSLRREAGAHFVKKGKLYRYLQQKGYEASIITEVINNITTLE
jgi:regulatory protein